MRNYLKKVILMAIGSSVLTAVIVSAGFLYFFSRPEIIEPVVASSQDQTVVDTVKKVNPAVVSITITKNVPIIERYFQRRQSGSSYFFYPEFRQRGTQEVEVGGGSGFFISEDGYIVTNRHVVEDPNAEYTVLTHEGKTLDAKVVSRDTTLDIAVLKVEGNSHPYLQFGDSNNLEVGQTTIAIGQALGEFQNTVSVGVISGLGRSIVAGDYHGGTESLSQLIQTDAAINQGNSGGPLLDINGKVIGVNVAIASGAQNIGFALPANNVKEAVQTMAEHSQKYLLTGSVR